jgi:integrase
MKFSRTSYQDGCLQLKPRKYKPDVWVLRYRKPQPDGTKKLVSVFVGTVEKYPTKAHAKKAAEHLRLAANPDNPNRNPVTVGGLIDRYLVDELPARYSSRKYYRNIFCNHIKPKWGDYPLDKIRPFAVQKWLEGLPLKPKTRAHIRTTFSLLFNCAMRWELFKLGVNPMSLVRVADADKQEEEPRTLNAEEFQRLIAEIDMEVVRVMATVAMCLGLRISELAALQWADLDWDCSTVRVRRAIVDGHVGSVKTKYSRRSMPLDDALAEVLQAWHRTTRFRAPTDWVFASPENGGKLPYQPYHLQQRHIAPAAIRAELGPHIGWHTFRHSYATMLAQLGTSAKVQQDLLRHASFLTTLNIYTHSVPEEMRKANRKVVRFVIPIKLRNKRVAERKGAKR